MVNEFENTLFLEPNPEKAYKPEVDAEATAAVETTEVVESTEVVELVETTPEPVVFPTLTAEEVTDLIFFAPDRKSVV